MWKWKTAIAAHIIYTIRDSSKTEINNMVTVLMKEYFSLQIRIEIRHSKNNIIMIMTLP